MSCTRTLTLKPYRAWFPPNHGFYVGFQKWLVEGGYGPSALNIYSVAARLAFGVLDKPYWQIDPEGDIDRVRAYIADHYASEGTRSSYGKGLSKLAEYLRRRCHKLTPQRQVNWSTFVGALPVEVREDVRAYVAHRRRNWIPEQHYRATLTLLGATTRCLRWLAERGLLSDLPALTPERWFEYVDVRLVAGIKPITLNRELLALLGLLRFLADLERPVCQRMLKVEPLAEGPRLPRDVPVEQVRLLLAEIEADANRQHQGIRRLGLMDRAWFLLMLHSGLRTGEVRRLRLGDLDLGARRARIEQSKGLKDRLVCLSRPTIEALNAYLAVRGPAGEHVFVFRHAPLSYSYYCYERLETYGTRCGVHVMPHQLRHTCATLLLNAGAPVLTVQTILGHRHVDTTLGYARLYDGTLAADYYRAMAQIEPRLDGSERALLPPEQLLALVDSLQAGTLNEAQRETVQALRLAVLALAETV
jgi:integrase/recombinase XerD